jgi:hypothetical protein
MCDAYEIALLDPAGVNFKRSPGGTLILEYEGAVYQEVYLYRAFPLSNRTQHISVRTPKGDEIGMIADLAELDGESRLEAEKELRLSYMIPQVIRIEKIRQNPGMWVWHLQTTMGPVKMSMRNLHEHVQVVAHGRWMLSDLDGNRCEIACMEELDAHSRKQLSRIM